MQPELERRGHAEVAAAAVQRPEQVRVLGLVRDDGLPRGGDEIDGDQVVTCEPERPLDPTGPTPEREAGDTCGRHASPGRGQAVLLRGGVELAPRHAGADARGLSLGIDLYR